MADPSESAPRTVDEFLSAYTIGEKLRSLRLRKKISLSDLGKHTGLSASLLSQLENGKLIPTLPTLTRIALVFDVGLEHFFSERRRLFALVRSGERMRFPDNADSASPAYYFECLAFNSPEKGLQAYQAEFPPREEPSAPHTHEGSEFVYVETGELEIFFDGEVYPLETGDSAFFDASVPHGYRSKAPGTTRALVVTIPMRL